MLACPLFRRYPSDTPGGSGEPLKSLKALIEPRLIWNLQGPPGPPEFVPKASLSKIWELLCPRPCYLFTLAYNRAHILDGYSKMVRTFEIDSLICLRHLFRSIAAVNLKSNYRKKIDFCLTSTTLSERII